MKATSSSDRRVSLDVFRGLTVAGMIVVNNPGTWSAIYPPLKHADWHGCTPTDLVFPFFLFIVGVAIDFSQSKRKLRGDRRRVLLLQVARRAAIIFALGLFLNGFPFFDLATLRVPGVLQRIAVCYALAAALNLYVGPRAQAALALVLMFGYWVLLEFVHAPGGWLGNLELPGTLPAWVDRRVFGRHIWKPDYDPEGLLSTLPALATTLWGVLAGRWLTSWRSGRAEVLGLLASGLAGVALGLAWGRSFPMNKALWTSSFVAFTAGSAAIALAACVALVDLARWRRWAGPFLVFGLNPILAFVGSGLISRVIGVVQVNDAGQAVSLKQYIYQHVFASWAEPRLASLLFALAFLMVCYLALLPLYRRGWAVRV